MMQDFEVAIKQAEEQIKVAQAKSAAVSATSFSRSTISSILSSNVPTHRSW